MHDCPSAEIRDLLPDHAHGTLTAAERARVDAHLATCAACRDELALLHAVRAVRPQPRVPDVARIVGALPRPAASAGAATVVPLDTRRRGRSSALPWRRIAGIAAVLVGVVGVGVIARYRGDGTDARAVVPDPAGGATSVATATSQPAVAIAPDTPSAPATTRAATRGRARETTDAVGSLGGIASGATEDELEALIGDLESLSGIPDVENVEGEESEGTGGTE